MQGTGGGAAAQNVSAANSPAGNTVTPDEKARYSALFAKSGPNNGLLDGKTPWTEPQRKMSLTHVVN